MERAAGDVVVLADDLIWATRLAALVRGAGATPVGVRGGAAFERALAERAPAGRALAERAPAGRGRVIVDLTSRAYDGIAAVGLAASRGCSVLCVGQHDDAVLWQRARDAGAARVLAYRALHESGPAAIAAWLERAAPTAA